MGSVIITAISVTVFNIRIYRGNGTAFDGPSPTAPAWDAFNYGWTSLTNRGNPNASPFTAEGHYAQIRFTANGTFYTRDSATV
jgi:hypothetical protein